MTYEGANTQSNSSHHRGCCMNMLTVYGLVGDVLMCVVQNQTDLKFFTQASCRTVCVM